MSKPNRGHRGPYRKGRTKGPRQAPYRRERTGTRSHRDTRWEPDKMTGAGAMLHPTTSNQGGHNGSETDYPSGT